MFGLVSHSVFSICQTQKIRIPPQSSSLSNTITAWRELNTRLGRHLLFPTSLSCLVAVTVQNKQRSLQRLFQVAFKAFNNHYPQVEKHSNLNTVGIEHVEYQIKTQL